MKSETVLSMRTSNINYGPGATREIGYFMDQLGAHRVMVLTDSGLVDSEAVWVALESLRREGIDAVLYDGVRIEPTDISVREAIEFATDGSFDGYVGVGGGSSMDTAKVANLYATYPDGFFAYVNAPIGEGKPVPGPLKPMIAVPTTAGTGSETTGVAIFDFLEMHAKTGIAHHALCPNLGIVDPNNTRTVPRMVAACTGFDVLGHALEALTALPFSERPAPEHPGLRPAYQGSNPISDLWAEKAIQTVSQNLLHLLEDPSDDDARGQMLLAATSAGIGFGNAGVHLPHGMSYPVSGMVHDYCPQGYPAGHPMIPHGMAVILNAPAVFRFTARANSKRHLKAAQLMGTDVSEATPDDAGALLSDALVDMIRRAGMPNGLSAVGYGPDDVERLVQGTLPQHRVTKLAPRPAEAADLRQLFLDSLTLW